MSDDLVGKIVIIEHPFFYTTHIVARIEATTAKMMTVRYWKQRRGWDDVTNRRKIMSGIIVLSDTSEENLLLTHDRLQSYRSEAVEREKAAWLAYHRKVSELGHVR